MTEDERSDFGKMLDEQEKIYKDRIRRRKIVSDTLSYLRILAEEEADEK